MSPMSWSRYLPSPATISNTFAVTVLVFLILPVIIVIPMSISDTNFLRFPPDGFTWRWYVDIFTNPNWTRPALFSMRTASVTAIFSTIVGTVGAYAIVRGSFRGKQTIRVLVIAPIIAPNIVLAIAIYFAFVDLGLLGTTIAFVFAHSILCVPFVVLSVTAALERFDPDLELAAMNLGANRFTAFRRVTLPFILPGVAAGAVFSFIISFDEPVISYFISSIRQATLPRVMFQNVETSVRPDVAAISTVLLLLSVLVILITLILRRRKGHDFLEG